ncbi:RHS repeat-associated core domain-containing protein [Anaerocolumna xylanovorans]|uniref:RHS repeat-associated core domain-containing protein n=1 Tax=Anaerocolumna xylanovorans DSM 12503 TaxID=1121345 RepID=A0A1M7YNV5_9FIRM|nr:RHS repeat-associated core domain-containing protein [Anaerocolumna xylanovorans]SHO54186.1 RHS repeat-associated core domain-containing protein [Anaerocolumna xylanovorans DSM 12503]
MANVNGYLLTSGSLLYEFNNNGNLIKISDLNGNQVQISINENGFPMQIIDSVNRTYTIAYSGDHIASITDPAGRVIRYNYEGNKLTDVYTASGSLVNQYRYDSNGLLQNIKDNYGTDLYTMLYDSDNRLISLKTEGSESLYSYSFDSAGNQVVGDGTDNVIYDNYGNIIVTSDGSRTIYANLYNDVTSEVTADGNSTINTYDQYGNIITETTKDNSGRVIQAITYNYTYFTGIVKIKICVETDVTTSYDESGTAISETAITTTTYDINGNILTKQQDKDIDTTVVYTYLSNGLVNTSIDEEGIVTTYFYDVYGYPERIKAENPNKEVSIIDYNYNLIGLLQSQDISGGLNYSYVYDILGNVLKQSISDGNSEVRISRIVYDEKGNVIQKITPSEYNASFDSLTVDSNGIASTDSYIDTEAGVRYFYDPSTGKLIETKVSNYDIAINSQGNLAGVKVAGNKLATYQYTSNEKELLSGVSYANGANISYNYDSNQNKTDMSVDGDTKYTYAYDENGKLLSKRNVDKNYTTTYVTNADGSTTVTVKDDETSVISDSYTLSEDSARFVDNIGSSSYGLNIDSIGNVDSFISNSSEIYKKSYVINSDSKATEEKISNSAGNILTTGYTYGKDGSVTSLINTNGADVDKTSYTYDSYGKIETISINDVQKYHYYYNIADELVRVDDAVQNQTITYSYDKNGNILEKSVYDYSTGSLVGIAPTDTVSYDYENSAFPDELASYDGQEISYDALGNPLSYLGYNMTWEAGRRLSEMENGTTDITFAYDDNGIRTSKTVNGVKTTYTSIEGRITSQNDGTNMLYFHYDKNNNLTGFNQNGTEYIYVKNAQGDITGVLDADGNKVVSYTYDAWGKIESISGSLANTVGQLNPMRYRGYYEDMETGYYYLQSRYYNPVVQRFLNADEPGMLTLIGTSSISANLFSYCGNNPVVNVDPNGFVDTEYQMAASIVAYLVAIQTSIYALCDEIAATLATSWIPGAVALGLVGIAATIATTVLLFKAIDNEVDYFKGVVEKAITKGGLKKNSGNTVYVIYRRSDEEVRYVGITNDFARRQKEHQVYPQTGKTTPRYPEKDFKMIPVYSGLSKTKAHIFEEALILVYSKDALDNMRHSIAKGKINKFEDEYNRLLTLMKCVVD